MANKRTYDLTQEPNLAFDLSFLVDKSAYAEAKEMLGETLLRSRVTNEVDETGNATATVSFANYNAVELNVDQDIELTLSGIKQNETVWLKIYQSGPAIVTFASATGQTVIDVAQSNFVYQIYRITRYYTVLEDITIITPEYRQSTDDAITITPSTAGIIILTDYTTSTINDNICNFEFKFTFSPTFTVTSALFDITNWNISKLNSGFTACSFYSIEGATIENGNAYISSTQLKVYFNNSISSATEIYINGQFKVK